MPGSLFMRLFAMFMILTLVSTTVLSVAAYDPDEVAVDENSLIQTEPDAAPHVPTAPTYYLPWPAGQSYRVSRDFAAHGYAIDFPMPKGTPILAAADGTIRKIKDHNTVVGGSCSFNNLVEIVHANGDISHYLHIDTNSVPDYLQVGSFVTRGTQIARSGDIGCTNGPHLHFQTEYAAGGTYNTYFADVAGGYVVTNRWYMSGNIPGSTSTVPTDYNRDGISDLYAINKIGTGGGQKTEVHIMNGADRYKSYLIQEETILFNTGKDGRWVFAVADYNRDGIPDLYGINKIGTGAGHKTEVHIMNGADRYKSYLIQRETILFDTGKDGQWAFALGDYNRDGIPDLYGINKIGTGAGHKTEVHIMNGADQYQSYLIQRETILFDTGKDGRWVFAVGDYNRDGIPDLYGINKIGTGAGHKTEIHIMNGADQYHSYLLNTESVLGDQGRDGRWVFTIGDYNRDDVPDVYAINKIGTGAGHKTEVHIMNGADQYHSYLLNTETALFNTDRDCRWDFSTGFCTPDIPVGYIDNRQGATAIGNQRIYGWARVDSNTASIERIELWIDGQRKHNAVYGFSRPDAGGNFGWEYTWDTFSESNGNHTIQVKAVTSAGAEALLITSGDHTTTRTMNVRNSYVMGDVNADGKNDLVRVASNGIFVRLANGTIFEPETQWSSEDATTYNGAHVADVTGDGKADIVIYNFDKVYIFRSSGLNFLPKEVWTPGQYLGIVANPVADVNGDGKADAIVVNNTNGSTPGRVVVRLSTGSQFTSDQTWIDKEYFGDKGIYFADVDGDGKADAIVVNFNYTTVRRSNGSLFTPNENWSSTPFVGEIANFFADVTGDGKADSVVVNNNGVYVRRSNGASFNTMVETWIAEPSYGNEGMFFSDVTGDGKADMILAINGQTFVRRSNGSSFGSIEDWDTGSNGGSNECTLSINNGATATNTLAVGLNLDVVNASQMKLANDGGFTNAPWQPYASTASFTLEDPGMRVATLLVYGRFQDSSNTALCGTLIDNIVYDPIEPVIVHVRATATGGRSIQSNLLLNVSGEDQLGGSGIAEMRVQTSSSDTGWIRYQSELPLSAESGTTFTVSIRDGAGNQSEPVQYTFVPSYNLNLPMVTR